MRSDEEVERLLEDWLEDEARPMPHEVLEGALESVARSPQAGSRRAGPVWVRGPMGILAAAAVLVLLVLAGGLAGDRIGSWFPAASGSSGLTKVWNPVADWRSAPNQQNPSSDSYGNPGVWSYMYGTSSRRTPGEFLLMPNYEGDRAWIQPGMAGTPDFVDEAWNEPALINVFVGLGPANSAIYLHPGAFAVLAWTSPVAAEIAIDGVVARPQDPCSDPGGSLVFSVDRGSDALRTIQLDHGQRDDFNVKTTVGVRDTVYFIVDAGADAICDLTFLQLTITSD